MFKIDISFIILTWNSEHYIKRCLDSIAAKCDGEAIRWEAIVVDNGSKDGTREIITKYQSLKHEGGISVIGLDRNRGTTYPRNLGLAKADGEVICILDSDTEFRSGSIRKIIEHLESDKAVGLVAPRLILTDGSVQNSVKKYPTAAAKILKVPRAVLGLHSPNLDFYGGFPFDKPTSVDTAISACWFFHRLLLDSVGFLDENIFYSPEDLDFCIRIRKSGFKIVYWPNLEVVHHTQQISHAKPFSMLSLSHLGGLFYYFRKHGGWFFPPDLSQRGVGSVHGGLET
jgi:GT2 family glycosyltransferase